MQFELPLNIEKGSIPGVRRAKRSRPVPVPEIQVEPTTRRERINYRNRVLIARYYYWDQICRRRYKDVLQILGDLEFFVEERTITNALLDYAAYLEELYKTKPSAKDLKKEYPSWCWDV